MINSKAFDDRTAELKRRLATFEEARPIAAALEQAIAGASERLVSEKVKSHVQGAVDALYEAAERAVEIGDDHVAPPD
jgi:hypothetical protein